MLEEHHYAADVAVLWMSSVTRGRSYARSRLLPLWRGCGSSRRLPRYGRGQWVFAHKVFDETHRLHISLSLPSVLIRRAGICRRRVGSRRCLVARPRSTSPPRRRTNGGSTRRLVSRFTRRCASHRPLCRSPCSSRWSRSRRRGTPIWLGRQPSLPMGQCSTATWCRRASGLLLLLGARPATTIAYPPSLLNQCLTEKWKLCKWCSIHTTYSGW